jgi:hypothetical protein
MTVWNYYAYFREMIKVCLTLYMPVIELPGPVEIDETFIGAIRRGNHGRIPGRHLTVFGKDHLIEILIKKVYSHFLGIKCRTTNTVLIFQANDRSIASIYPFIFNHVRTGATIYSDMASTYVNNRTTNSNLSQFGFNHLWVNHSERWVDEIFSDIHINSIERVWRSLKRSIYYVRRPMSAEILDSYISAFLFYMNIPVEEMYDAFLTILGSLTNMV